METSFIAVINDPLNPIERTKEDGSPVLNKHGVKKTFTQSYKIEISGDNAAQFLGRSIGDEVDGIYIGDGETTLSGYKLQITGGSDKTGTPMRADIDGGGRKSVLVHASTGFKGTVRVTKSKKGEKRVFFEASPLECGSDGTSEGASSQRTRPDQPQGDRGRFHPLGTDHGLRR